MKLLSCFALALATASGCSADNAPAAQSPPFIATPIATFDQPWAMTFLPDGRLLVTEKPGRLFIVTQNGRKSAPLSGVPKVAYGGQGGLMDVVLHPDFASNHYVYISYSEPGEDGLKGTALARATLTKTGLDKLQVIWRQEPKVTGDGHFSGRIAFSPDGHLFVTSGERQKFDPAQDMTKNLGKVIRLTDAGGIPSDNPFYDQGRVTAQIWSYGHRNLLGIAFDKAGRLWEHEMGPWGGDEFNLIVKGANYGWPIVSEGRHYSGIPIPPHRTHPEFKAPKVSWNPVIAPAGLIIYSGNLFPGWKGSALIGGLASKSLVRVAISGDTAREAERFAMGHRIREVEQGPDGAVWLLEDGEGGRLLKLTPKK